MRLELLTFSLVGLLGSCPKKPRTEVTNRSVEVIDTVTTGAGSYEVYADHTRQVCWVDTFPTSLELNGPSFEEQYAFPDHSRIRNLLQNHCPDGYRYLPNGNMPQKE